MNKTKCNQCTGEKFNTTSENPFSLFKVHGFSQDGTDITDSLCTCIKTWCVFLTHLT